MTDLKRLLVLGRDLLQARELPVVIGLIGQATHELLQPTGVVMLVRIGAEPHMVEVDQEGRIQAVDQEGALFDFVRQIVDGELMGEVQDVAAVPAAQAAGFASRYIASLIAAPFPPMEPHGALGAFWGRRRHSLGRPAAIVRHLGELAGAAIGNVETRRGLADELHQQGVAMAQAAGEHAQELEARDLVEDEVRRLAMTDALTGLWNRRGFFIRAEQSLQLARRQRVPSALIFADIDGLKTVNDEQGHEEGDQLLRDSARILRDACRGSDVVARLGGDEFAAFTLDDSRPEVIRARIEEETVRFNQTSGRPYTVSLSIGIVPSDSSSDRGLSLSDYLAIADEQMYARKKARRVARAAQAHRRRGQAPRPEDQRHPH